MNQRRILLPMLALFGGALALPVAGQTTASPFRFETMRVEPPLAARAQALADELGASDWRRPAGLYVAPAVDRALFGAPEGLREVRACTAIRFGDEPWGRCQWSWNALGQGRQSPSTGSLDLQITLTPSAQAAQELLLSELADNMMMVGDLARLYQAAERPAELGDLAFLVVPRSGPERRLWFLRSNVVFRLRGHGSLSEAVLPFARRLDAEVLAQPPLTREELFARRPAVQLGDRAAGGEVGYSVRLAGGGEVVAAEASIDGQPAPAPAGKVHIGPRRGPVAVEVVTVTRELLAGSARARVEPAGDGY